MENNLKSELAMLDGMQSFNIVVNIHNQVSEIKRQKLPMREEFEQLTTVLSHVLENQSLSVAHSKELIKIIANEM